LTCYQRHLESLFDTLGLSYDKENRARVDTAIREILDIGAEMHCPEVWAAIKALTPEDRDALPARVAELM
jgi:hypothetical protein